MGVAPTFPMVPFDHTTQNLTEAFALETELENSTQTHPATLNHPVTPVQNDGPHTNANDDSRLQDPPAIDTDDEMGTVGAPTQATVDMELDRPNEAEGDSDNSDAEIEPDESNNMDVDIPMTPLCIDMQDHLGQLLKIGIDVHLTYCWPICIDCLEVIPKSDMHGHRRNHHPTPRHSPIQLPHNRDLLSMLAAVGAVDLPFPVPSEPIPRVNIIKVVPAKRCTVGDCLAILADRKRLTEHARKFHQGTVEFRDITAHSIGMFKRYKKFVEILPGDDPGDNIVLADVLAKFDHLRVGLSGETYQTAATRQRSPFLAKTDWDHPIQGVNLSALRPTAHPPTFAAEPDLYLLKGHIRNHFQKIAEELKDLKVSILTLRHLRSAKPRLASAYFMPSKLLIEDAIAKSHPHHFGDPRRWTPSSYATPKDRIPISLSIFTLRSRPPLTDFTKRFVPRHRRRSSTDQSMNSSWPIYDAPAQRR